MAPRRRSAPRGQRMRSILQRSPHQRCTRPNPAPGWQARPGAAVQRATHGWEWCTAAPWGAARMQQRRKPRTAIESAFSSGGLSFRRNTGSWHRLQAFFAPPSGTVGGQRWAAWSCGGAGGGARRRRRRGRPRLTVAATAGASLLPSPKAWAGGYAAEPPAPFDGGPLLSCS